MRVKSRLSSGLTITHDLRNPHGDEPDECEDYRQGD